MCSLVLCSVDEPDSVLRQLFSLLRPGGELRFLEHVASSGLRGRLQKVADATVWPRLMGNCHTHRDTEASIVGAGFALESARREPAMPVWFPTPVVEYTIGRAVRTCLIRREETQKATRYATSSELLRFPYYVWALLARKGSAEKCGEALQQRRQRACGGLPHRDRRGI